MLIRFVENCFLEFLSLSAHKLIRVIIVFWFAIGVTAAGGLLDELAGISVFVGLFGIVLTVAFDEIIAHFFDLVESFGSIFFAEEILVDFVLVNHHAIIVRFHVFILNLAVATDHDVVNP